MSAPASDLDGLLRSAFHLHGFRPYQEAVCRAVVAGRDVLLVMPTGAGKSLCYQLPGLALGGATLVISPLIALIEDQVGKLRELGLRAERIHSGREREESRRVCRELAEGRLDFLFIAPERLAVPGFPEFLAKHKPGLIAVDEAHCISHWGHDFRPDYRLLGPRLKELRPAPIIALTATATPRVQDDIAEQLGLALPKRFIHGFRRDNIGIEVLEQGPAERHATIQRVLANEARRPAIVYARTRKEADELATVLAAALPAAAYHAGMAAQAREEVQARFLTGELEAIVATIAFGMGIDKADLRTVLHSGIPATLEGYYQEIGRAGRDGKPARAVLLYSWADRRNHEYFHGLNYPETGILEAIHKKLGSTPQPGEAVRETLTLDADTFERALEKLWMNGGAVIDPEGNVSRGKGTWRAPYEAQREHRLAQLELTFRFAETHRCRMLHLVEHFGDQEDSGLPCGLCDVCAPDACSAARFRAPTSHEEGKLRDLLEALSERDGQTTGQLHRHLGGDLGDLKRKVFEGWLGALVRGGWVRLAADAFDKDGRTIHFQRAYLTREGSRAGAAAARQVLLPLTEEAEPTRKARGKAAPKAKPAADIVADEGLVEALREWRRGEARRRNVPAFHILHESTLKAIAALAPKTEAALLAVSGMGPKRVEQYGAAILQVVGEHGRA